MLILLEFLDDKRDLEARRTWSAIAYSPIQSPEQVGTVYVELFTILGLVDIRWHYWPPISSDFFADLKTRHPQSFAERYCWPNATVLMWTWPVAFDAGGDGGRWKTSDPYRGSIVAHDSGGAWPSFSQCYSEGLPVLAMGASSKPSSTMETVLRCTESWVSSMPCPHFIESPITIQFVEHSGSSCSLVHESSLIQMLLQLQEEWFCCGPASGGRGWHVAPNSQSEEFLSFSWPLLICRLEVFDHLTHSVLYRYPGKIRSSSIFKGEPLINFAGRLQGSLWNNSCLPAWRINPVDIPISF